MPEACQYEVNPHNIRRADVVVCIPSYNEADSIGHPTTQADLGLKAHFSGKSSVIINCDNGSPDHTREAFLETPTDTPKIYLSTPPGLKGKGNNLLNLFQKTVELGASAVVMVDADLTSITPAWIKHLGEPLFNGFDYVAPLYVRDKYDATITNGIAYPLTRALYGRRVRQPIGGDFGFSGKLAGTYLKRTAWDDAVADFGIDIWMTTLAIHERLQICQSFVGRPKIHRTRTPGSQLGVVFRQVVGTIFSLMNHFEACWTRIKFSRPTAIYGLGHGETEPPPRVDIDGEALYGKFRDGFSLYGGVWQASLSSDVFNKLNEIAGMEPRVFDFPTDLWVRVLFETAGASRHAGPDRDALLDSLVPLHFGRTLSFAKRTRHMTMKQAEEAIEEDCMAFELAKPYLLKGWVGE